MSFLDLCRHIPHGGTLQIYCSTIRAPYTSAIYLITNSPLYSYTIDGVFRRLITRPEVIQLLQELQQSDHVLGSQTPLLARSNVFFYSFYLSRRAGFSVLSTTFPEEEISDHLAHSLLIRALTGTAIFSYSKPFCYRDEHAKLEKNIIIILEPL